MTVILACGNSTRGGLEAIAAARALGGPAAQVIYADLGKAAGDVSGFISHGADAVVAVTDAGLDARSVEGFTEVLHRLIGERAPSYVVMAGNKFGRETGPRLAERLKAACINDVIRIHGDGPSFERLVLSGNSVETVAPSTPGLTIVTIHPHSFEPLPADASRKGEVAEVKVAVKPSRTRLVEVKKRSTAGVDISAAQTIVCGGRGFKKKEDFQMLYDLAKVIGAEVGGSRPIGADLKWIADDKWIGLSGKEVKPRLYIAAGISGQIQHLSGIRSAKTIVVINSNKDAPFFKECDYGLVADLYKALPLLTEFCKRELKR
ncbi:MAG: electron transfer flavoprotein subunit alpha/FixB family protein [Euryarchaeota archaeon]|nr:electron transfer flavoprotein subunit alpha/FixB family protein [Euryarchaeota archaeon]